MDRKFFMDRNVLKHELANELKGISYVLNFVADSILEKNITSVNINSISRSIDSLEKVLTIASSAVIDNNQLKFPLE